MNNSNFLSEPVGETTEVEIWLARAGLKFADLGNDPKSAAIKMQWREYQATVYRCCMVLHLPPAAIQLSGVYAHLRIPCATGQNFEINC
ncbi:hypothetical protein [Nostoc sp. FACHB-110]|uniref:hypothetical protein n=1 Tax=Nostoc sp. FACHB-110 TaxID=2692834 RepID=UPI0016876210|nr:hypothetical protein [Nostoc sp. FACHB-110]MBD2438084.1 hypothetical protein [Nostoc sp. FACHB-110]